MANFKQDLQEYTGQQGQDQSIGENPVAIGDSPVSRFQADLSQFNMEAPETTPLQAEVSHQTNVANNKRAEAEKKREERNAETESQIDQLPEPKEFVPLDLDDDNVNVRLSPKTLEPTPNIEIDYANVDLSREDLTAVPEGTVGGHCGVYAENVVKLPNGGNWLVGDTIGEKKQSIERYRDAGLAFKLGEAAPQAGNAFIMNPGTQWGHVAVANKIEDGTMTITEANWRNDKRVTHNRKMRVDDPRIVGFLRTK